jgi:hypothetical protein
MAILKVRLNKWEAAVLMELSKLYRKSPGKILWSGLYRFRRDHDKRMEEEAEEADRAKKKIRRKMIINP